MICQVAFTRQVSVGVVRGGYGAGVLSAGAGGNLRFSAAGPIDRLTFSGERRLRSLSRPRVAAIALNGVIAVGARVVADDVAHAQADAKPLREQFGCASQLLSRDRGTALRARCLAGPGHRGSDRRCRWFSPDRTPKCRRRGSRETS
jgi:hypothetical protein